MGKRNKALASLVIVGQPYLVGRSHPEYDWNFYWDKNWGRGNKRLKVRRAKKLVNRWKNNLEEVRKIAAKYPIGSLFNPCGAPGNDYVTGYEFGRTGGILWISGIEGKHGSHGFGGCGDCSPVTQEQAYKNAEISAQYWESKPMRAAYPDDVEKMAAWYRGLKFDEQGVQIRN